MTSKEYIAAELRCLLLRARLVAADIEAVGLALKHGISNVDQGAKLRLNTKGSGFAPLSAVPTASPMRLSGGEASR